MMEAMEDAQVAALIADRRQTLKLSMREAARRGGISPTTWSDLENGKAAAPSDATQRGVAQSLGWPLDWLDQIASNGEVSLPANTIDTGDIVSHLEKEVAVLQAIVAGMIHELPNEVLPRVRVVSGDSADELTPPSNDSPAGAAELAQEIRRLGRLLEELAGTVPAIEKRLAQVEDRLIGGQGSP